ncbi:uncharacterized protein LOC134430380 [Melospiza melodia melodia]|uniref:uncharacterized protein LOC134430380 n=1 Tax=Melospiza melodia melodia TaxID=1914991 RepID=UPI002FD32904
MPSLILLRFFFLSHPSRPVQVVLLTHLQVLFLTHFSRDIWLPFLRGCLGSFPVPSPQGCPGFSPEVLFLSHPSRAVELFLLTHLQVLFLSHLPKDAQVVFPEVLSCPISPRMPRFFSPEVFFLSHLPRAAQAVLAPLPKSPSLCQQTPSPPAQSHSLSPHLSHLLLAPSRRSWPTRQERCQGRRKGWIAAAGSAQTPALPALNELFWDYFSFCGGVWAARGTGGCSVAILAEFCQPVPPLLSEPRPQSFGIVPFPSGVSVSGFIFNFLSQIKGCQPPFPTGLARSCSGDRFGSACTTSETLWGSGLPTLSSAGCSSKDLGQKILF